MQKSASLFDSFSYNLEKVLFRLNGKLNIEEFDESDRLYLCPVTLKVYSHTSLSEDSNDKLTVEHVPPKCVGGKGICLTAKDFNNKASDLDFALKEWVEIHGFYNLGLPLNTTATIDDLQRFYLKMDISTGEPNLIFTGNLNNPKAETIIEKIKTQKEFKVKTRIPNITISVKTKISILKNAYLIAFSKLGYEFIFDLSKLVHPEINKIRECVISKDENFDLWFVNMLDYPDDLEGLSFIVTPEKRIALSVCFKIREAVKVQVLFPCPGDEDFEAKSIFPDKIFYKYYTMNHLLPLVGKANEGTNQSYWNLYFELRNLINV